MAASVALFTLANRGFASRTTFFAAALATWAAVVAPRVKSFATSGALVAAISAASRAMAPVLRAASFAFSPALPAVRFAVSAARSAALEAASSRRSSKGVAVRPV